MSVPFNSITSGTVVAVGGVPGYSRFPQKTTETKIFFNPIILPTLHKWAVKSICSLSSLPFHLWRDSYLGNYVPSTLWPAAFKATAAKNFGLFWAKLGNEEGGRKESEH